MAYRAGDSYFGQFFTYNPTTAMQQDADILPTAVATRNGADDAANFPLTVTKMSAGRYRAAGTIPASYTAGDKLQIVASAVVGSVSGSIIVDKFVVDNRLQSEIYADMAKQNTLTAIETVQVAIRVFQAGTTTPIPGVAVLLMNEAQTVLEAEGTTNVNGEVLLAAEAGTKQVRMYKPAVIFSVPSTIVIVSDLQSFDFFGSELVIPPPLSPEICQIYDFLVQADGVTPTPESKVFAEMEIVKLPYDYGGRLHAGGVLQYEYDAISGLIMWSVVKGAKVSVHIRNFLPKTELTIPDAPNVRLIEIASL